MHVSNKPEEDFIAMRSPKPSSMCCIEMIDAKQSPRNVSSTTIFTTGLSRKGA